MNAVIVGAMDGVSFDNVFDTLNEYQKVLFVEPIPYYFNLLERNSKKLLTRVYLENSPISDVVEEVELAYLDINALNRYEEFYKGCSSIMNNGKPINRYLKNIDEQDICIHKCQTITFDMLCEKWAIDKIDYLQIDCEGYDQRIVNSIDLEKYSVNKLKFETHYLDDNFINTFSNKWPQYTYEFIEGDIIYYKL
jgi:FkbM family methyltransferase